MATPPRNPLDILPEFRAPPPSPAAGAHNGGPESPENDEFSGFLSRSHRIPELILPDRIFHREKTPWNPPEIDFQSLVSPDDGSAIDLLRSTAASIGCFQIVNHGIRTDLIAAVEVVAAEAFRMSPEKKKAAARLPERRWGFEVEEEETEEKEGEEFFWWSGGREEMAGTWNQGYYKDFR